MESFDAQYPIFRCNRKKESLALWKKVFLSKPAKFFPKKTTLIEQGETPNNLFYIVNGLVEYTFNFENGSQGLIDVNGDGNVVGLLPLLDKSPSRASFITVEDSSIIPVSKEEIFNYMRTDLDMANELTYEALNILSGLMTQLYSFMFRANRRIEWALYMLAEQKWMRNPDEAEVLLDISQEDLARMSRTTRVTVTKALTDLKNRKALSTSYGGILIQNMDELRKQL